MTEVFQSNLIDFAETFLMPQKLSNEIEKEEERTLNT
jgi:hypothetical protein